MESQVEPALKSELFHQTLNGSLPYWQKQVEPTLVAIDDMGDQPEFLAALSNIERLGLRNMLKLVKSNFVGASSKVAAQLPQGERLDLIWFDAKGSR